MTHECSGRFYQGIFYGSRVCMSARGVRGLKTHVLIGGEVKYRAQGIMLGEET